MLNCYGPNIWAIRAPMSMLGTNISTQMTIVRLPDQSLILISPIKITDLLKSEISTLGKVVFIISPNTFHHLFASQCQANFKDATYLRPATLADRIKNLPVGSDLYAVDNEIWQGQLETRRISQSHMADEMVFFHPESKSLVITDLIQYSDGDLSLAGKVFAFITGTLRKPAISRLYKTMIKDKQEMRSSLEFIMDWDFERVLLPHNCNIQVNAKKIIRQIVADF